VRRVYLTEPELQRCAEVGRRIRAESLRHRLRDKHGFTGDPELALNQQISGACGEYAASLVYRIPWEGRINNFHGPDLGQKTQVRTLRGDWYDLIVRPTDAPEHFYILVCGQYPHPWFNVVGHILGAKARQVGVWRTPNGRPPAWFVPQKELTPAPPPFFYPPEQLNLL
jgi:hypothetical protein